MALHLPTGTELGYILNLVPLMDFFYLKIFQDLATSKENCDNLVNLRFSFDSKDMSI